MLQWHDPFSFDSLDLSNNPFLFLLVEGLPIPFRVEEMEVRANGVTTVLFADIISNPSPVPLQGLQVYATLDVIDEQVLGGAFAEGLEALVGIDVASAEGVAIGRIVAVDEYLTNVVLTVLRSDTSEVLIPLSEDLIISFPTEDSPLLSLHIPEGLLEL